MTSDARVVLITGPMGSGKSTLAADLAARLGWACISEDEFWTARGWSGLRTVEQETVIQHEVLDRLLAIQRSGGDAVLEFILYAEPPNPLTAYEQALAVHSLSTRVILLKPAAAEILRRIQRRARPGDLERLADRAHDVDHQLRVLEGPGVRRHRTLDTTDLTREETVQACLLALRESGFVS